jgi:methyl-accepting chemotaxis protein
MKNQSFLSRWSNNQNLQARLTLIFTILFVFCIITISILLFNITKMISYNSLARNIFEDSRQVYQLELMLKQYQLGLKHYVISSSPNAEQQLAALDLRIDETIAALKIENSVANTTVLERVANKKEELSALADRILIAVDEQESKDVENQDWGIVAEIDEQADLLFKALYADVSLIRTAAIQQLDDIGYEAETYRLFVYLLSLLVIPAFLALALIVALIVYLQINLPVEQLVRATRDLQERKFNPADIEKLSHRSDEIGAMARDFIKMAIAVEQRTSQLQQEANEIRAKIR